MIQLIYVLLNVLKVPMDRQIQENVFKFALSVKERSQMRQLDSVLRSVLVLSMQIVQQEDVFLNVQQYLLYMDIHLSVFV